MKKCEFIVMLICSIYNREMYVEIECRMNAIVYTRQLMNTAFKFLQLSLSNKNTELSALSYMQLSVKITKEPWVDLLHRHMSVCSTYKIFAVY